MVISFRPISAVLARSFVHAPHVVKKYHAGPTGNSRPIPIAQDVHGRLIGAAPFTRPSVRVRPLSTGPSIPFWAGATSKLVLQLRGKFAFYARVSARGCDA